MKNAKKTKNVIKKEAVNNNANVEVVAIERVTEITYNALKGANVDMSNYAILNHRIKTDAKLDAMKIENPKMYNANNEIHDIHVDVVKERFNALGKSWKITVTIKNDGDEIVKK